jgi:uncharacterized coiled-coil protein SlyX
MATEDDVAERVLDLEVRLAYQDRTIVALDEVVRDLASKVEALQVEVARLREPEAPVPEGEVD